MSDSTMFLCVATEVRDDTIVEVYRDFQISIYDGTQRYKKENGFNAQNIYCMVDSLTNVVYAGNGNISGLLDNLLIIKRFYTRVQLVFNLFYNTFPRLMFKVYEKIYTLKDELNRYIEQYVHLVEITQVLNELIDLLEEAKEGFHCFWCANPESAIRIPYYISQNILSTEIFLTDKYLPYIMGNPLPKWVDPQIVMMINEARKIYHTRIQTIARRKELIIPLSLLKMSSDIVKIIIEYTPIDIVFESLPIVLPFDLLGMFERQYTFDNKHIVHIS